MNGIGNLLGHKWENSQPMGPTADGLIDPIFQERLVILGDWLALNAQGIYGTRVWSAQNDSHLAHVWYTAAPAPAPAPTATYTVYAHVLLDQGPGAVAVAVTLLDNQNLSLASVSATRSTQVSLLGYSQLELQFETTPDGGICIYIPLTLIRSLLFPPNQNQNQNNPFLLAWVFKLEHVTSNPNPNVHYDRQKNMQHIFRQFLRSNQHPHFFKTPS